MRKVTEMKETKPKRARNRRGMSLLEVVIALTVITIISASALSLVLSSAKSDAKALRTTQVIIAADNALECFKFADNEDEFKTLITKTGEYVSAGDGSYVLTEEAYTVTVTYSAESVQFKAVDNDNEVIYEYVYPNGGTT